LFERDRFTHKKAQKYLRSADILIREDDYESCISRVYYAMFYAVQAILLLNNMSFSSHKSVISSFGELFVKKGIFPKEMGRELNRAFEKRQIGDYAIDSVISEEDAKDMLIGGRVFVNTIIQYLKQKDFTIN